MSERRGAPGRGAGPASARGWAPAPWQLLLAGALLALLWAVVLSGLGAVFELRSWLWRAITISTATAMVGCGLRAIRPSLHASAAFGGVAAGALCWAVWFGLSGRAEPWWRDPLAMLFELWTRIDRGSAPLDPSGPLEDLVLLVVLLASGVSALLLVGLGHPLAAGAFAAALLLVPAGVTGFSAGWAPLLATGLLLALLAWLGSPAPNWVGLISAGAAVAVAAGAVAVAPPTRDRVWNSGVMLGPLSSTIPDVTIALADDLRRHSETRAFTFTGGAAGPQRFALATLSEFEGGRWSPQHEPDPQALTVDSPRTPATVPPQALSEDYSPQMDPVTISIDGLLSNWLPLPQSTLQVTDRDGSGGFDPQQWVWNADSATARADGAVTRAGYTYRADAVPLLASGLSPELLSGINGRQDGSDFIRDVFTKDAKIDPQTGQPIPLCTITIHPDGTGSEEGNCDDAYSSCLTGPIDPETGEPTVEEGCITVRERGGESQAPENQAIPGTELLTENAVPPELTQYLELPAGMPKEMLATARRIADNAKDRLTLGMRLQDWFRKSFTYDESAPYEPGADPNDPYAVMTALLKQKRGFCVHFASTFAVMARALGAPTRIVVGYAARSTRSGEETMVRGTDLHAWPEIYFDGRGWVAFEPTPGGAGVLADEGREVPATPSASPSAEPTATSTPPSQRPSRSPSRPDTDPAQNPVTAGGDRLDPGAIALLASVPLLVILLLLPAAWRLIRRRRRLAAIARGELPAQHAWAEFADTLVDLGLPGSAPRAAEADGPSAPRARTPEATIEHLEARSQLPPEAAEAARRLAAAMAEERYGGGTTDAATAAELLGRARDGLLAQAPGAARSRAGLLPRSLLLRAPRS